MHADALPSAPAADATPDEPRDLGFGARVAERSRQRLLNRDGSFNVRRTGLPLWRTLSPYQTLASTSWPRFFALLFVGYLAVNLAFALAYLACGPQALEGGHSGDDWVGRFADAFFFSVQTLATIGYGRITPVGLGANLLVALEALVGIVGFALATGLAFARFSRPSACILWSERAVIAPYREGHALMFRLANQVRGQLVQVEAQVILSRFVPVDGRRLRRFEPLPLERAKVMFLPLHWTLVHPIGADSPLHGRSADELLRDEAEVLVLISAFDETTSQTVHARTSYHAREIAVGARFADMFQGGDGNLTVDLRRLHAIEPA
jgi:inward rectifier potassium channel